MSLKCVVRVFEARGIKAADVNGKSDPYCKLKIKQSGNSGKEYRTKVLYKTLEPIWNEEFTFQPVSQYDTLQIQLYDHDSVTADDFLGMLEIPLSSYLNQTRDEWKPLLERTGKIAKFLTGAQQISSKHAGGQIRLQIYLGNGFPSVQQQQPLPQQQPQVLPYQTTTPMRPPTQAQQQLPYPQQQQPYPYTQPQGYPMSQSQPQFQQPQQQAYPIPGPVSSQVYPIPQQAMMNNNNNYNNNIFSGSSNQYTGQMPSSSSVPYPNQYPQNTYGINSALENKLDPKLNRVNTNPSLMSSSLYPDLNSNMNMNIGISNTNPIPNNMNMNMNDNRLPIPPPPYSPYPTNTNQYPNSFQRY